MKSFYSNTVLNNLFEKKFFFFIEIKYFIIKKVNKIKKLLKSGYDELYIFLFNKIFLKKKKIILIFNLKKKKKNYLLT
jgi:hypothetical protein